MSEEMRKLAERAVRIEMTARLNVIHSIQASWLLAGCPPEIDRFGCALRTANKLRLERKRLAAALRATDIREDG